MVNLKAFLYPCAIASVLAFGSANAAKVVPVLGTQYLVYDTGTYNPEAPTSFSSPPNNWYMPGQNFKTPVGLRHLDPTLVDQQIDNMRASGIDLLALQMPLANIGSCEQSNTCNDGFMDGVWGEALDFSQYALRSQQQTNLKNIVHKASDKGFRYIVVSFNNFAPSSWSSWNETEYQMAWNLMVNTRALVYSEIAAKPVKLLFDLAPKMIGVTTGQTETYVKRLWADYTRMFGVADTVGGSLMGDPAFLPGLSWYGAMKPSFYAFDIFQSGSTGVGTSLVNMWNGLGTEKSKPILLMGTYHNDAMTASELQTVLAMNPTMNLLAVVQSPTTRQPVCPGCQGQIRSLAIQSMETSSQVSNYLPIAEKVVSDNSNSAAMRFADMNCAATSGQPCTIKSHLQFVSGTKNPAYQVYVRSFSSPANSGTLLACNTSNTTNDVSGIQRNTSYIFEYYSVPSCKTSIVNMIPNATSIVSVR